jgi:hypothetical protein
METVQWLWNGLKSVICHLVWWFVWALVAIVIAIPLVVWILAGIYVVSLLLAPAAGASLFTGPGAIVFALILIPLALILYVYVFVKLVEWTNKWEQRWTKKWSSTLVC